MTPELGIIEGYFGTPWNWPDRTLVMRRLRLHGYTFFHYAPKADPFLRRRWQEPHPESEHANLECFATACRSAGVRFGVGLSPYELFRNFGREGRAALKAKIEALDSLGLDDLAILFDDMRGDQPDLAAIQAEIVHEAAGLTRATRLIMCPSYYTDDPILDRAFGQRPPRYLEDLGERLDSRIAIFWTGPEVCAKELTRGHCARVAESLRRKPFLWDNYPVNDGPRMSQGLHLRAFTGRHAAIADTIAAHAVNPALQPHLTLIPALTLPMLYTEGDTYDYERAFTVAAQEIAGDELAHRLRVDLLSLQETGRDRLGDRRARLREIYAGFDRPCAREVVAFLDGEYEVDASILLTQ